MPNRRLRLTAGYCLLLSMIFIPECCNGGEVASGGFSLRSVEGRVWSLDDLAESEVVVIAFLGTECPLAQRYGRRLADMSRKYASRGVAFIGVMPNVQDSITEIGAYGRRLAIPFPLLRDDDHEVARRYGATRTPEVCVLDSKRQVRYQGRIDDQFAIGISRDHATETELKDALEALLKGEDVAVAKTDAPGCIIGRKKATPTGDITYNGHIAKIFNSRCVECHREGEIAPFPLRTYDDVIGWEDMILEVVQERRMPPWFANPDHGTFANDARLTDEERGLIETWVQNGAPEGAGETRPKAPTFVTGWRIPEPDEVFKMSEQAFSVPAEGVVDYKYFTVDPGWDEDKYIYAAEARPDNTSVVHHILVYVIPPNGKANLRRVLVGYAPGSPPKLLEDGIAMHVPAGSKLLFEMHYTPNGYAAEDRSYVGVCFIDKEEVRTQLQGRLAIQERLNIPPFAAAHEVDARFTFHQNELLLAMSPHMHLRGKSFRYVAEYPDGSQETLLDIPNYDFNWQLKYTLAEPKAMPAGTKMVCTAVYDNSEDNLANPDPTKRVRWGDQSFEEMMIGFFDTIRDDRETAVAKSRGVRVDPTGEWQWTTKWPNSTVDYTLQLDWNGETVIGALDTGDEDLALNDAYIVDDTLHFSVTPNKSPELIAEFEGKVSRNRIRGKIRLKFVGAGRTAEMPWKAERTQDNDELFQQ